MCLGCPLKDTFFIAFKYTLAYNYTLILLDFLNYRAKVNPSHKLCAG